MKILSFIFLSVFGEILSFNDCSIPEENPDKLKVWTIKNQKHLGTFWHFYEFSVRQKPMMRTWLALSDVTIIKTVVINVTMIIYPISNDVHVLIDVQVQKNIWKHFYILFIKFFLDGCPCTGCIDCWTCEDTTPPPNQNDTILVINTPECCSNLPVLLDISGKFLFAKKFKFF